MGMILKNLTPILILVLLIIWGLLKKPDWMVKGFSVFVKDMDERGKVINMAFAVSSAFVFGDHLGFIAGVNPEMIVPVIAGKLAGGISAIGVAVLLTRRKKHKKEAES
ncbi:MAG: ethanolamine utilization protein EutH [Lachnospiraceae bacterium]|nr:ethanolamine utilization protein EutH [Lachnospiraceae bacterium]